MSKLGESAAPKTISNDGKVRGDVRGVVKHFYAYIIKFDNLLNELAKLASACAMLSASESEKAAMDNVRLWAKIDNASRSFRKELNALYGQYAKGNKLLRSAAKAEGVDTKRKWGKRKKESLTNQVKRETIFQIIHGLKTRAKDVETELHDIADLGMFFCKTGDKLVQKNDALSFAQFASWVNLGIDFAQAQGGVIYGMVKSITIRVDELERRKLAKSLSTSTLSASKVHEDAGWDFKWEDWLWEEEGRNFTSGPMANEAASDRSFSILSSLRRNRELQEGTGE